ncbi:hypothetical protein MHYP_G00146800 [Metynnis hypsauchen]
MLAGSVRALNDSPEPFAFHAATFAGWQTIFMSASVSERNHCWTAAHKLGGKGYQGRAVGGSPAGLCMGGRALLPIQTEKQQRSNLLQTFLDLSYELVLGLSTDIYESMATRLLGLEMALCQAEV